MHGGMIDLFEERSRVANACGSSYFLCGSYVSKSVAAKTTSPKPQATARYWDCDDDSSHG